MGVYVYIRSRREREREKRAEKYNNNKDEGAGLLLSYTLMLFYPSLLPSIDPHQVSNIM